MKASLTAYEWTLLRRDRRAWWALLCLGALVLLAFVANSAQLAQANADKHRIAKEERARWLGQGEKDPHSAAHYSIYAFKPAPILAALDPGVEPYVGQALWLEAHAQNDMLYRPQGEASLLQRSGAVSPAGLLIGFAPLVAFLLAFGAMAVDRERGTLRLALGAATRPAAIVKTKALAIWLALLAVLLLPSVLAAAALAVARQALDADFLLRLGAWSLTMAAWLGLLAALGLAVASLAHGVRTALAVLFGVWIVFALALPRWADSAVERARPLPTTQSVKQRLAEEAPAFWTAETGRENQARLLAQHGVRSKEALKVDLRGAELDMSERHGYRVFDRVLGDFYQRVLAQDRAYAAWGWLSPAIAVQSLSPAYAGSDFAHHRAFIDGAEAYRRTLVNRMNQDVMAHPTQNGGARHTNDVSLWSQIPEFRHAAPTLTAAWGNAAPALWALSLWCVLGLSALALAARRLRP
ncbi:DUF3526 domain-containing protein [Lysobacter sp. 5GHs7-4]|uniref:DUF3526 domain-containing protein n=1 Tax=Lysobacter sp. 5GHs7-4 TaxID=2904253 RepID=UPI001E36ADED|nr:DUF3526 domain-containing protein [Lysobacter sp. 5GHs7-4]UHQ25109.1 DUF3526 domain-containing protein [Lysobacter sp. 5GHs7-4]